MGQMGVANAELRHHYSAADVVLNDHWPEMRQRGFLSNRLYDALAFGACVVSDHVAGIEAEFDDVGWRTSAVSVGQKRGRISLLASRKEGLLEGVPHATEPRPRSSSS
jgi:hypothetical protein